jgi:hypothetical protein
MPKSTLQRLREYNAPGYDPFPVRRPAADAPLLVSNGEVVPLEEATGNEVWERNQRFLTKEERSWIYERAEACDALLRKYVEDVDFPVEAIPAALDVVFAKWLDAPPDTREPSDQIRDQCGALFGEFLVSFLDRQWQLVADDIGTDYAVWSPMTGSFGWPFATVRKRIRSGENNFFHSVFLVLKESGERT